ncbi:MAG: class I SAM-dependent methyltransferase [Candidatus Riflebacteria bacterium]|nr:class I SAM-dependent methyltransferase [Candidatus Riflebacteria bacterium]
MRVFLKLVAATLAGKSPLHHVYFEGRRVLDIACGTGNLPDHDTESYVGVDISDEMLRRSRESGRKVVKADACRLPFRTGSFGAVNCANIIEHLHPPQAAAMVFEAGRVLAPGGVLLIRTPSVASVWNTFSHVRPYPPAAIQKLLTTATEDYVRTDRCLPKLAIERVFTYGSVFDSRLGRLLTALLGLLLPWGHTGYAVVLRRHG